MISVRRLKKIMENIEMHKTLGEFDVIYTDIPYSYSEVPYFKKSLAIQNQYPTLSNKDILNIDVESIAKKNCWLFFWSTWAGLPFSLEVMTAWGFSYRTCAFVWAKKTKNNKNAKTYGRCCTQGSTEVVLCGKRGSPKRYAKNVEQFLESLRRGNSQKPDEIYGRIDKVVDPTVQAPNSKIDYCKADDMADCPNYMDGCWCHVSGAPEVKKIELFARQQWGDWYALGNDEALDNPENDKCLFGDIRNMIGAKDGTSYREASKTVGK